VEYALSTIVRLDAIAARARYALWQGSCRPVFVDTAPPPVSNRQAKAAAAAAAAEDEQEERSAEDEYSELLIWVNRLQHPLLLAKAAGNKRVSRWSFYYRPREGWADSSIRVPPSSHRQNSTLPPGGARVNRRASALLGCWGSVWALHRLSLPRQPHFT